MSCICVVYAAEGRDFGVLKTSQVAKIFGDIHDTDDCKVLPELGFDFFFFSYGL